MTFRKVGYLMHKPAGRGGCRSLLWEPRGFWPIVINGKLNLAYYLLPLSAEGLPAWTLH